MPHITSFFLGSHGTGTPQVGGLVPCWVGVGTRTAGKKILQFVAYQLEVLFYEVIFANMNFYYIAVLYL